MGIWSRLNRLEAKIEDMTECDNCHALVRYTQMKRVSDPIRNLVLYCKRCAPKWDHKVYDFERHTTRYFVMRKIEVDEQGNDIKKGTD